MFTRIVLQIPFRISQWNGKKVIHDIRIWISLLESTMKTGFSEVKSICAFDSKFRNPDFPIERNLIILIMVKLFTV